MRELAGLTWIVTIWGTRVIPDAFDHNQPTWTDAEDMVPKPLRPLVPVD